MNVLATGGRARPDRPRPAPTAIMMSEKPDDCVLLLGIPATLEDFDSWRRGRRKSHFLETQCSSRVKFSNEIDGPLQQSLPMIVSLGCTVVTQVGSQEIRRAFEKRVVIVFSHWTSEGIELADGLMDISVFRECVPADYCGTVDLCACHPWGLADAIKGKAPNCLVHLVLDSITPSFWIEIIRLALVTINRYQMSYSQALGLVIQDVVKKGLRNAG